MAPARHLFINLLPASLRPTAGTVLFKVHADLTAVRMRSAWKFGIARTFRSTGVRGLSVLENV